MGLTIVRFLFYGLAGLAAIAAVIFIIRALVARSLAQKKVYGVDKQNERQRMMVYAYYSVGLFILGLIFVGAGSLTLLSGNDPSMVDSAVVNPSTDPVENVEALAPAATSTVVEPTIQRTATATSEPVVVENTPTVELSTDSAQLEDSPATIEAQTDILTPTTTVEVVVPSTQNTATVNSPIVGLYLRAAPSGEILERLEDQVVVTLLDEQQTVDGIDWVKVVSANGNEGWVAAEFLVTSNP